MSHAASGKAGEFVGPGDAARTAEGFDDARDGDGVGTQEDLAAGTAATAADVAADG